MPQEQDTLRGHYPGVYAALVMPQYAGSIEMQLAAEEPELVEAMNRMMQAIEHVDAKGFVHMDMKTGLVHGHEGRVRTCAFGGITTMQGFFLHGVGNTSC